MRRLRQAAAEVYASATWLQPGYVAVERALLTELAMAAKSDSEDTLQLLANLGIDLEQLQNLGLGDDTRRALLALAATGMPADGIYRLVNQYATGRPICLENEPSGVPAVPGFVRVTRSEGTR